MQQRDIIRLAEPSRTFTGPDKNIGENSSPKAGAPSHSLLDTTAMIRSLQRSEGVEDCYRRGRDICDQTECPWRLYCLTPST